MAKKKATSRKKAARKAAKRKPAAKKKVKVKRSAAKKKRPTKKKAKQAKSLGRAKLPADAKLDIAFQKDYQAREIFAFLGVETIRELEEFGPDEIIRKLAGPVVQTVDRIRKALALNNRCLADDKDFALEFKASMSVR